MSSRPPLPFGLGRDPQCDPSRCHSPGVPLPPAGAAFENALANLFSTFYATSLRYLGVSEILDWTEGNSTVEAWISTGLLQGRLPSEVGNVQNLETGRGAIKSVINAALNQNDEAWATSLREVGFSSGMSMAFEGIVAQLMPPGDSSKNSPLPCLHTLISSSSLAMLKSAPLKHAFPILPPRATPSSADLFASIKSLIASKSLTGPAWKDMKIWKPEIRRAHAHYTAMVKEVAEEIVCDPAFSIEYNIFLESISQPVNLFDLISQDFDTEFPGASRGLLGVGEVGGQNLIQIMDFCAARRPSELLARVKLRVAERGAEQARAKEQAGTEKKEDETTVRQGSSKDLLYLDATTSGPFSACAPRSASPALQSCKGKGKALVAVNGVSRTGSRYASRAPRTAAPALPNGTSPTSPPTPTSTRKTTNSSPPLHAANGHAVDHAPAGPGCCVACATAMMQSTTISPRPNRPTLLTPHPSLPSSRRIPQPSPGSAPRPPSPVDPPSLPTTSESNVSAFSADFTTNLADQATLDGRAIRPLPSSKRNQSRVGSNISPSSSAGDIKTNEQEPVVDAEAIQKAAIADWMGFGIVAPPASAGKKKKSKKKKGKASANGTDSAAVASAIDGA